MRFDRLMTLYVTYPLLGARWGRRVSSLPILMYHSVSQRDESGKHPYHRINVSPAVLAQQMKWLRENQYRTVSLPEAVAHIQEPGVGREKLVVLTFDDGYSDFYTSAYPILEQYGFSATVFLPTAFVGRTTRQFNDRGCLTWREIGDLRGRGMLFGSHTVNHPDLRALPRDRVEEELRRSRDVLQDRLGVSIDSFSYPYAFPEDDADFVCFLRETLDACGYKYGVTTVLGMVRRGDDPFFLKRLPVNSEDDIVLLRAKMAGAYDWLRFPQRIRKRMKG